MSENYHLTDEDLEAIDRIVEGSVERAHGEQIPELLEGANEKRSQRDPLIELLEKAHRERPGDDAA